jgi:beta-glucosidase-like glycosyl hydrolase
MAINAGIDLLLFSNELDYVPYSDDRGPDAVRVILDAVSRGDIAESRIDEACGRILALKSRLQATGPGRASGDTLGPAPQ